MTSRPLLVLALSTLAATLLAWTLQRSARPTGATSASGTRIASLSPGVTETLYAIGAGAEVVGVDDYSDYPSAARSLPHLGSGLGPSYEAIAAASPTLILTEQLQGAKSMDLGAIAAVHTLPWLTLDEIVDSTRALGRITGHVLSANALAARLARELGVPAPAGGPRVLLVLRESPGRLEDVYFIKRNSIHGAALHAAGARNAIDEDVASVPRLSLERLVALDPDLVIVLTGEAAAGVDTRAQVAEEWRSLSALRAVRSHRVGVVMGPEVYSNGPRVLDLPEHLKRELARLNSPSP